MRHRTILGSRVAKGAIPISGTITITGLSASEPGGQRVLGPISIQGTQVVGLSLVEPLVMGDNTFTFPSAGEMFTGVVIIPPTGGSVALTVRFSTNIGDAGLPISPILPTVITFAGTVPTSVILNAQAAQASPVTLWFW